MGVRSFEGLQKFSKQLVMAAKARAGKLENTIEQCRNAGTWQKSIELAEELKSSSSSHGEIFRVVFIFSLAMF